MLIVFDGLAFGLSALWNASYGSASGLELFGSHGLAVARGGDSSAKGRASRRPSSKRISCVRGVRGVRGKKGREEGVERRRSKG